ncbi:Pex12 amino terminal region-domain-containing protein [Annulohypoxylon truncatum]|uniref:Pex12 amino terminal region-domain-containing protein n=1 Tax=Annulohypoxylon truncatum TaxID=327061 RepID=UPI0020088CAB|nr:Pex12 amino terminal region-domain-containing protein [Annulohypoxylon truncatum]KAI1207949.1 Pex12 amino terminal region-domain-containing protein [Annulohypoxylon truncatum]
MEFVSALQGNFDDQKPSLFELLSEQQLNTLLPPTLRYLLTVATHRYPRYLLRALNSFDELYAVTMLIVERYYLKTRGGSFTEHFYGLKREKALHAEIPRAATRTPELVREQLKIGGTDIWKNLAVMVGIPYIKRKLDESHEIEAPRALLGANYTRMPANPTLKQRFLHYYKWFIRNIYPSVHAAYYFAIIAFNLAYLFDSSKYHNPFMWLIGTRIRRMNAADFKAIEALGKHKGANAAAPAATSIFNPRTMGPRLLGSLSLLLPTSIFALKFLEWWYASDFAKQLSRKAAENLELPPPIVSGMSALGAKPLQKKAQGEGKEKDEEQLKVPLAENAPIATPSLLPIFTVPAPEYSELCPICEDEITTATACQTGVVYCYACIHKWHEGSHPRQEEFMADRAGKWENGQGRCAVTGRRVLGGTEGLRRIMV